MTEPWGRSELVEIDDRVVSGAIDHGAVDVDGYKRPASGRAVADELELERARTPRFAEFHLVVVHSASEQPWREARRPDAAKMRAGRRAS
jgi:hypothetical protein